MIKIDADIGNTKPAVCISGGIDSTVVLHHVINDLMHGRGEDVYTFTATFGNDEDEKDKARRVADYYGTHHTEVLITRDDMFSMFKLALGHYPFPRLNLWTWPVVRAVCLKKISHLFIGEGGDELFGYPDRSFLEGWAGQLVWVWPAWEGACEYYRIKLHAPFKELQKESFPITEFYVPPNKALLGKMYSGILPDFVISQRSTPPSHGFYKMMGMSKKELQIEVCKIWLEVNT
jgi:asparagine synthetase B (glutamine-hydrolysing)